MMMNKMRRVGVIAALMLAMALSLAARDGLKGKHIYVNPGHGGWTINDRPLATINHAAGDTTGFFETSASLWKSLELAQRLRDAGAKVTMSRTKNGYVADGDPKRTPNDRTETYSDADGQPQLVTLAKIAEHVEKLKPDYFISLHSNAATEGKLTNYQCIFYRGEYGAEYSKGSQARAELATVYLHDNPLTVWTDTIAGKHYVTGDLTWYGVKPEKAKASALGYKGYLAVLKHSAPGFLVESSFHTYHPERHRLLNRDYCRLEGLRCYRAIRDYFGGEKDKLGHIAGLVKSATDTIDNKLFKFVPGSFDRWLPINGATVTLCDRHGKARVVKHTDDEYNGFFAFFDVKPGRYIIRIEAPGYKTLEHEVTVKADEVTYMKMQVRPKKR